MTTTIEIEGHGTVEVEQRAEVGEHAYQYDVRLKGVSGRVLIRELEGVPMRAPSGQGWRPAGEKTLSYEEIDAIAAAIIRRDWATESSD